MSTRDSTSSPHSSSDRHSQQNSDVSGPACPSSPLPPFDVSPRGSSKLASSYQSPMSPRSRGSPKETRPSPRSSAASPKCSSRESPRISNLLSKFSSKGAEQNAASRSPKELFGNRASLASSAASPGSRSQTRPLLQVPPPDDSDSDAPLNSREAVAAELNDYIDDPLMKLRTNREHSDLVIRERDDEPHLRFMSLHFTPATPQAVQAFRSDWSEERDALLQDDGFPGSKRAAFFWFGSDKRSPAAQSLIMRPSETRQVAASDHDASAAQSLSGGDANGTADHDTVTSAAASLSGATPSTPMQSSDTAAPHSLADSCCHAVIHNTATGAMAMCTMRTDINASAVESLVDLPATLQPASTIKHSRPCQPPRRGRPPLDDSSAADDSSVPSLERRSYSSVTFGNLGKDVNNHKTKCCIVPSMHKFNSEHANAADAPDVIVPALGSVGDCSLEDFEEFDSTAWDKLSLIDREIRYACVVALEPQAWPLTLFPAVICSFSFSASPRGTLCTATQQPTLYSQNLTKNTTNSGFRLQTRKTLKLRSLYHRGAGNYKIQCSLVSNPVNWGIRYPATRNQKVTMQFAAFVSAARAWTTIKLCFAKAAIWLCINRVTASRISPKATGSATAAFSAASPRVSSAAKRTAPSRFASVPAAMLLVLRRETMELSRKAQGRASNGCTFCALCGTPKFPSIAWLLCAK